MFAAIDPAGWASTAPGRLAALASWASAAATDARRRAARISRHCATPQRASTVWASAGTIPTGPTGPVGPLVPALDPPSPSASGVLGGMAGIGTAFARGFAGAAAGTVHSTIELASVGIGNATAPARALAATVEHGPAAGVRVLRDQGARNVRVVVATAEGLVVSMTDTVLLPVHFADDVREHGLQYAAEEAAEQAGETAFSVAALAATGGIAKVVGASPTALTAARAGGMVTGSRVTTLLVTTRRALRLTGAHSTGEQRRRDREREVPATTVEACTTEP